MGLIKKMEVAEWLSIFSPIKCILIITTGLKWVGVIVQILLKLHIFIAALPSKPSDVIVYCLVNVYNANIESANSLIYAVADLQHDIYNVCSWRFISNFNIKTFPSSTIVSGEIKWDFLIKKIVSNDLKLSTLEK